MADAGVLGRSRVGLGCNFGRELVGEVAFDQQFAGGQGGSPEAAVCGRMLWQRAWREQRLEGEGANVSTWSRRGHSLGWIAGMVRNQTGIHEEFEQDQL